MASADSDIIFQSYGRCCNKEGFFVEFYERFMGESDHIRAKFTHTDMPKQRAQLRQGILHLVMYARGMPDHKLQALGKSHSRHGHDIHPEWYDIWLNALMDTLRHHDAEFTAETEAAWRRAIQPGIDLIRSAY